MLRYRKSFFSSKTLLVWKDCSSLNDTTTEPPTNPFRAFLPVHRISVSKKWIYFVTLQRKIQPKLLTTIVQVHLNLFFLLLLQAQPGFHKQGFPQQHLSTTTEKKIFCRKLGLGKNEKLFFVNSLLLMVRISNLVPGLLIHRLGWWSATRAVLNYVIYIRELWWNWTSRVRIPLLQTSP